ncbi:MAG: glycosyltransferase family 2 protein [Alphaproteobacteria bacterium]
MVKSPSQTPNISSGISILIPTFQRSQGLQTALASLFAQEGLTQDVTLIVADNNKTNQEKAAVEALNKISPFEIRYIHVGEAGLSNARNGGMSLVDTRFIAFLDDDMRASPQWLATLVKTAIQFKAGITFSPVIAVMPDPNDKRNPYMEPYFSSLVKNKPEGIIETTLGMGGCLLDLSICELPSPIFDPARNHRGGEDDMLFTHLRRKGAKAAWSPQALTYEIVPAARATTKYIRARNFGYGQGPTRIEAKKGLIGAVLGTSYYMMTGTLQAAFYGPIACILRLANQPAYVKYLALTARAFGKVFWWDQFNLKLYGNSAALEMPATTDFTSSPG